MKSLKIKSLYFILLSLTFCSLLGTKHSSAKVIQGTCGENAAWKYNSKTKVMKISGTGAFDQEIPLSSEYTTASGEEKEYFCKKIVINEGITSIGPSLLNNTTYYNAKRDKTIQKIMLPDSLEEICPNAFHSLLLSTITIPKNVKKIGPALFSYSSFRHSKTHKILLSKDNPYFKMKDDVIFNKNCTTLVYYSSSKKTKKYVIPNSVTKINPMAFAHNYYIKQVILPKKLTKLGGGAFYDCSNLKYININKKTKISNLTPFNGAPFNITRFMQNDLDYEEYSEEISDQEYTNGPTHYIKPGANCPSNYKPFGTFAGTNITSLVVPRKVKYLSTTTIENTPINELTLTKNFCGDINTGDYYNEKNLHLYTHKISTINIEKKNKKYEIKNNILYSKDGTILYMALTPENSSQQPSEIIVNEKVTRIAQGAFYFYGYNSQKKTNIKINGNLDVIEIYAFDNSYINKVIIEGNVSTIEAGSFYHSKLHAFICNGAINSIGAEAFSYNADMKEIKLGTSISSIGDFAFEDCYSITEIKLFNLSSMGEKVFDGCSNLINFTISGPLTSLDSSDPIGYCEKLNTVILPTSLSTESTLYQRLKNYKHYVEIMFQ